jgi:two-component system, chemotaxis family, sensor kinase CheA
MDLRRFLDAYVADATDHLQLLQRSLLALERDGHGAALDEAFRAAHTLKGLAAAMGFDEVTGLAHGLEDRLEAWRNRAEPAALDVDALLADADLLEQAIAVAVAHGPQSADGAAAAATRPAAAATARPAAAAAAPGTVANAVNPFHEAPPGTRAVVSVQLEPDAPIKAARAMLILRALQDRGDLLGTDPNRFGDDFSGTLRLFLLSPQDLETAEADIRAAGDVASVEIFVADAPAPGAADKSRGPRADSTTEPVSADAGRLAVAALHGVHRYLRVDAGRMDFLAGGIGELSILFGRLARDPAARMAQGGTLDRMEFILSQLQQEIIDLRMIPVGAAFERLARVVRDAARRLDKDVDLDLSGEDVRLDRAIIDELGDPLVHLLRNAVDHGIECRADRQRAGKAARGRIEVRAERERTNVRITVRDDGAGVAAERIAERARAAGLLAVGAPAGATDDEVFRLLSQPGLSTATSVGEVSGRGVGMDVVVSRVRALGGAIDMKTTAGVGTEFTIRLPATLALAHALRVRVGAEEYAIPLTHITEAVDLDCEPANAIARRSLRLRGETVPLVSIRAMLQVTGAGQEHAAVIARSGTRRAGLMVDELIGREQILVKSFDAVTGTLPFFSGATLLADGRPVLVLDPLSVL